MSQTMQMTAKIVFLHMTILGTMVPSHGMMVTAIELSDTCVKCIKKVRNLPISLISNMLDILDFHAPIDPWLPDGTPNSAGCRSGWIKFGGGCFRYFGDKSQGSPD